jgi:hypothetical protein
VAGKKINTTIVQGNGAAYSGACFAVLPGSNRLVGFREGSMLKLGDFDGEGACGWILRPWAGSNLSCNPAIPVLWQQR